MADDPTKPKASADSTPMRELAREWFAEAREASVHDDAEVKTWKVARQSGRKRGLFES
jgi:hypothetical protein